jgi:hypothetical protein
VLQLQPDNIKALFRGARAALKLGEWVRCEQLLAVGLQVQPDAEELLGVQRVRLGEGVVPSRQ